MSAEENLEELAKPDKESTFLEDPPTDEVVETCVKISVGEILQRQRQSTEAEQQSEDSSEPSEECLLSASHNDEAEEEEKKTEEKTETTSVSTSNPDEEAPKKKHELKWDKHSVMVINKTNANLRNRLAKSQENNSILQEKVNHLEESLTLKTEHCRVLQEQYDSMMKTLEVKTAECQNSIEASCLAAQLFQSQQEIQKLILDKEYMQDKLCSLQEDRWREQVGLQKDLWYAHEYVAELEMLLAPETHQNFAQLEKEKELKDKLVLAETLIAQLVTQIDRAEIETFLNARKHEAFMSSHVITNTLARYNRRLIYNNQKLVQELQHLRSVVSRLKFSLVGAQVARDYFKNTAIELGLKMKHTFDSIASISCDTPIVSRLTRQASFSELHTGRMALELTPDVAEIFKLAQANWLQEAHLEPEATYFAPRLEPVAEGMLSNPGPSDLIFYDCNYGKSVLGDEDKAKSEVESFSGKTDMENKNNENNNESDDSEDEIEVTMDYSCPFENNPPLESLSNLYDKYRELVGYPPYMTQMDISNMTIDDVNQGSMMPAEDSGSTLSLIEHHDDQLESNSDPTNSDGAALNEMVSSFIKQAAGVNGVSLPMNILLYPSEDFVAKEPGQYSQDVHDSSEVVSQDNTSTQVETQIVNGPADSQKQFLHDITAPTSPGRKAFIGHKRTGSNVSTASVDSMASLAREINNFDPFGDNSQSNTDAAGYASPAFDDSAAYCMVEPNYEDEVEIEEGTVENYSLQAIVNSQPGHDDTWTGDSEDYHALIRTSGDTSDSSSALPSMQNPCEANQSGNFGNYFHNPSYSNNNQQQFQTFPPNLWLPRLPQTHNSSPQLSAQAQKWSSGFYQMPSDFPPMMPPNSLAQNDMCPLSPYNNQMLPHGNGFTNCAHAPQHMFMEGSSNQEHMTAPYGPNYSQNFVPPTPCHSYNSAPYHQEGLARNRARRIIQNIPPRIRRFSPCYEGYEDDNYDSNGCFEHNFPPPPPIQINPSVPPPPLQVPGRHRNCYRNSRHFAQPPFQDAESHFADGANNWSSHTFRSRPYSCNKFPRMFSEPGGFGCNMQSDPSFSMPEQPWNAYKEFVNPDFQPDSRTCPNVSSSYSNLSVMQNMEQAAQSFSAVPEDFHLHQMQQSMFSMNDVGYCEHSNNSSWYPTNQDSISFPVSVPGNNNTPFAQRQKYFYKR